MYQQNLPHYKQNFLCFSGWITEETEHYIFHFTSNSEANADIEHIKTIQEEAFGKIISLLNLPFPKRKIEYFFYPDAALKEELMGDGWFAQSIYNEFRVHVLYTKEDKPIGPHEDTHLLTLSWGLSLNFLQEGLAEYMVGHCWDGVSHEQKVREGVRKGIALTPSAQLSSKAWFNLPDESIIYFYALAGSWTRFLIEKYGMEKYKNLYQNLSREMTEEEIKGSYLKFVGKDISELEREYFTQLDRIS